jgi:hypothetical protein
MSLKIRLIIHGNAVRVAGFNLLIGKLSQLISC